jgi:hypothetical protein
MKTRERLASLIVLGVLTATCGDPVAPSEKAVQGRRSEYAIAGAGQPSASLVIDDFIRLFVDDAMIGEYPGCVPGMKSCSRLPVRFDAYPGSRLTIEAFDTGGSYGMDEVWLYKNGAPARQLFAGFRCNEPTLECPTPFGDPVMYLRRGFNLP